MVWAIPNPHASSCFLTLLLHVGPRCLGCRFHHPRNSTSTALCCAEIDPCLAAVSLVCKQTHSPQQEKPEDCYQIWRPGCWLGQQRYYGKVKDSFQIHSCSEETWSSFWINSYFWDSSGREQMLLGYLGLPLLRAEWLSLLAPLDIFVLEKKLHCVQNEIPKLHWGSPSWEHTKQGVGTCSVAAAGLAAVATVWAGGPAACALPSSAAPRCTAGTEGEGGLASSNSCISVEVAKDPKGDFCRWLLWVPPPWVVDGRRRKGEAEGGQLGISVGPIENGQAGDCFHLSPLAPVTQGPSQAAAMPLPPHG